jgi:hypothetical protein
MAMHLFHDGSWSMNDRLHDTFLRAICYLHHPSFAVRIVVQWIERSLSVYVATTFLALRAAAQLWH